MIKKILVIEGDFINPFMIKQFLEDDFKMLYARDSHEVVKIMNEHFVDLVLLNAEYDSVGLSVSDLVNILKIEMQLIKLKFLHFLIIKMKLIM